MPGPHMLSSHCRKEVSRSGPRGSTLLSLSFGQDPALGRGAMPSVWLCHTARPGAPQLPQHPYTHPYTHRHRLPHPWGTWSLRRAQCLQQGPGELIPQGTNNPTDQSQPPGMILAGSPAH